MKTAVKTETAIADGSGANAADLSAQAVGSEPGKPFSDRDALEIMRRCPRFERCSAPSCPLDLLQEDRVASPGEPKCKLGKNRRVKIGAGGPLPRKGMTKAEWAASRKWEGSPEDEKNRIRRREGLFWSKTGGI